MRLFIDGMTRPVFQDLSTVPYPAPQGMVLGILYDGGRGSSAHQFLRRSVQAATGPAVLRDGGESYARGQP
jgi:hypothetical protein